jgi:hypothetical protein
MTCEFTRIPRHVKDVVPDRDFPQRKGEGAARYAVFSGGEREAMRVETATRFLTSVVDEEDCAYSTQKQALNALAFFFKQVCARPSSSTEPVACRQIQPCQNGPAR